jgi:hydroxymethylpyrimidine pyrophosphatase-like HAD family hydrolase
VRPRPSAAPEPELSPAYQVAANGGLSLDLLLDFAELAERASRAGNADDRLDQFLVAAGLQQIVDDYVHRDTYSLAKVARHARAVFGKGVGGGVSAAARGARAAEVRVREARRGQRAAISWGNELAPVVTRLAGRIVAPARAPNAPLGPELQQLTASIEHLPRDLRRSIVRLPQCFRSFDMRPADCGKLVEAFADRWPDRERPLLVIGLRSAGSWLGPLHAALLGQAGYEHVETMTIRPGQDWLTHERAALSQAAAADALAILVDEPPRSGRQLALAARELERLGFAREAVAMLVPLFEAGRVPLHLEDFQHVLLPWPDWSVHEQLEPQAVLETLMPLLSGRTLGTEMRPSPVRVASVADVERIDRSDQDRHKRGHVNAVFRVQVVSDSGARQELLARAEGVGLGYLGEPALTVAEHLRDFVPEVYGVSDGLLYRAWLPDEWRLRNRPAAETDAARVAAYVRARATALAVGEDTSMRLEGRDAVWENVAGLLGDAFGGAKPLVRHLVRNASRRLLTSATPSIVDGSMTLSHWFELPGSSRLLKVDFSERAFSNEEMYCYDPVYDLACAAASSRTMDRWDGFADAVRDEYERTTGRPVPDTRWLLYELVHHEQVDLKLLRAALAAHEGGTPVAEELARSCIELDYTLSRACQDYFHRRFFADVEIPRSGPLCAIDVDWVLETRWRSFPATSPSGALALRALARHGYRAVLATGRSLEEVRERCRAYRLAGGVAEYGGVVYNSADDHASVLLDSEETAMLEELRGALSQLPGVHVNPFHSSSIRAHRIGWDAHLIGLDAQTIEDALITSGTADRVRVVVAGSQTDFVPVRIDKGLGVRILAAELGEDRNSTGRPLALAVGDTLEDLPMLALAELPIAPVNAEPGLRRRLEEVSGRLSRHPCQAGLLDGVRRLLGHDPRDCSTCRNQAPLDPDDDLLLTILGALDGGRRRKLRQATLLAARLRRPGRSARPTIAPANRASSG